MKSRTLISFCQIPSRKPCHGSVAEGVANCGVAAIADSLGAIARYARVASVVSNRPVCRAIISSSFVGIIHTDTALLVREMQERLAALAGSSNSMPSQEQASQ